MKRDTSEIPDGNTNTIPVELKVIVWVIVLATVGFILYRINIDPSKLNVPVWVIWWVFGTFLFGVLFTLHPPKEPRHHRLWAAIYCLSFSVFSLWVAFEADGRGFRCSTSAQIGIFSYSSPLSNADCEFQARIVFGVLGTVGVIVAIWLWRKWRNWDQL